MAAYRVGTFCEAGKRRGPPKASWINAYTLTFNEAWPGCIVYEVEASDGTEAKRIATKLRLEHERAQYTPEPPR